MAIICGTDLTPASEGALAVARALAKLRGDHEIVLVHVVTPESEADIEATRATIEAQIDHAGSGCEIRPELVTGPAETALTSFAETENADLVVIAAGGRSTLGATAARIINITRTPLLVVRDPKPWLAFAEKSRPMRLLAAVDESIASELGLQWAHGLRAMGPVEVVLGGIYYPDDASEHYGLHAKTLVDRDPEIERLVARDMIRRFVDTDNVVARTRRGLGRIGDHLIELADEEKVDAIVIGTSQKTGLARLGSVSEIVVEEAPQSVICVPPNATLPTFVVPRMASALVATDLSPFANRAVAYAYSAVDEGGEIHIVNVVDADAEVDEAEIMRQLLAQTPRAAKARTVQAYIVRGDNAATAIAQTAARLGVDFITIASHGRSGITRALMGSVADRLLRATRKPVLVLRPG